MGVADVFWLLSFSKLSLLCFRETQSTIIIFVFVFEVEFFFNND